MQHTKAVFFFIAAITAVRLWFITLFPLLGDEAYYWQWARHMDFGFYEQGPGVAVVIWLFTLFTNINTIFTVRLGAVILSAATMMISFLIYNKLYSHNTNRKENFINILNMASSVIFAAGSILMMHDTVMGFFAALFILQMLYICEKPDNNTYWGYAGLILGLGVISKLTLATFYPAVIIFALTAFAVNKKLFKSLFIFTLFTLIAASPYIYWNITHDFATLKYLFIRGGGNGGFTLKYLGELIGAQFGLISPFLFLFMMAAGFKALKNRENKSEYLMAVLFFVSIIPYLLLSLKSRVEANWPAYCFLPLFFITTRYIFSLNLKPFLKKLAVHGPYTLGFIAVILIHIHLVHPILPIPEKANPLKKAYGYKELAEKADGVYNALKQKGPLFIASRHYQTASLLAFYMKDNPEVYCLIPHESRKHYRFWDGYKNFKDGSCMFIYGAPWEHAEMAVYFTGTKTTDEFFYKKGAAELRFFFDYNTGFKGIQ
ncbi:MAG: glycosyltransferase family 39 protein [Candidatus Goldbacteria bacterium]|nr:glycosyltransferase family 39 protein [Candidatus Goldiibacteriota bacterium]